MKCVVIDILQAALDNECYGITLHHSESVQVIIDYLHLDIDGERLFKKKPVTYIPDIMGAVEGNMISSCVETFSFDIRELPNIIKQNWKYVIIPRRKCGYNYMVTFHPDNEKELTEQYRTDKLKNLKAFW